MAPTLIFLAVFAVTVLGGIALAFAGVFLLSKRVENQAPLKGGVTGTAEVVSVTMPYVSGNTLMTTCQMDVVLTGPGIHPSAAKYSGLINVRNRPSVGQMLPASIDPANPNNFVILWAKIPNKRAVGEAQAQQMAAALREREGKKLGRGYLLAVSPLKVDSDCETDASLQSCSIRIQIFVDGQLSMVGEGTRSIPRRTVELLKPGRSFIATWVDPAAPNDFLLDFAQVVPKVRLARSSATDSVDWLHTHGTDGTATILAVAQLEGVQNCEGDDFYVIKMNVISANPPYVAAGAQALPVGRVSLVKAGAELPIKIGTTPSAVIVA